jgi:hypothetical protein
MSWLLLTSYVSFGKMTKETGQSYILLDLSFLTYKMGIESSFWQNYM